MTRKATNNTGTKRKSKAPCASDEERKERRRAANRRSAQKSRYREMVLMDELQKTVSDLSKRNATLKEENDTFRRDLAVLQSLMNERKLRAAKDAKLNSQSNNTRQLPLCPTTIGDTTNADTFSLSIMNTNAVERTPSPVESLNLNPDKIFPDHNAKQLHHHPAPAMTAENLFRAIMVAGAGGFGGDDF